MITTIICLSASILFLLTFIYFNMGSAALGFALRSIAMIVMTIVVIWIICMAVYLLTQGYGIQVVRS